MGLNKIGKYSWLWSVGILLLAGAGLLLRTTVSGASHRTAPPAGPPGNQSLPAPRAVETVPLEVVPVDKVVAADGAAGDAFSPVGLSGGTLIVGAWLEDENGADSGSAYIFSQNQGGQDNWGQVIKLTASDGVSGDWFGFSVAIAGDLAVVGAPQKDSARGAAYVFSRNATGGDQWGQVAILTASDRQADDLFGSSVAIFGETIAVGAPEEDALGAEAGAMYVFTRNQDGADNWGQVDKITASDGQAGDRFGTALAVSLDTLLVSAPEEDAGGSNAGAAYVFTRNQGGADNWGQVAKLTASDGAGGDAFGAAVALDDGLAIVGAPGDDDAGSASGAAYLFTRNQGGADNWGQAGKLTASDAAADDQFGAAVGIQNDAAVVAAPGGDDSGTASGAAYAFERNYGGPDLWNETGKLPTSGLGADDGFGSTLAMRDNRLVLGAPGDDDQGSDAGAAYLYRRLGTAWTEVQKPLQPDPDSGDQFGKAVALSRSILVAGMPFDDEDGTNAGAALLYARNQGGADQWGYLTALAPTDRAAGDEFGTAVAIDDDTIVVGAPRSGGNAGAAYVFSRNQGGADNWGQLAKLTAGDPSAGDQFGHAVTIFGDLIVVGAPFKDASGPVFNAGAAYVFGRNQGGADNWGQVKKLVATNPDPSPDQEEEDWFGHGVSTNGDILAISKPNDSSLGDDAGSVYLFQRNRGDPPTYTPTADNWGFLAEIQAADGAAEDRFGWSLDLDHDTLVVGAINSDVSGVNAGVGYVFERNTGGADTWGQVAQLVPDTPANYANLGWSVEIHDHQVLVGAPNDLNGLNSSGAVYLFVRNQGGADQWGQRSWIAPQDANEFDLFGSAVALYGNTIAAGMYTGDPQGVNTGAVYMYQWDINVNTLMITKTGNPGGTVPVDELVEYNLTYVNFWPEIVTSVVITDIVPYPLTNLNYFSSGPSITLIPGETYAWQVADLAPGQGGVITIQGEFVSGLTEEISFGNTATIRGTVAGITETWATSSVTLTVDLPLTANAGGPYFVAEGSSVLLDASSSAEGGSPITEYAWDLDNDTIYEITATSPTTLFDATPDDGVQTIRLRVTDASMDQDTTTTTVTVENVPPVVDAGPDWIGDPGVMVVLPPATFTDPGVLDTFTYTIDWGDGTIDSGALPAGSGTISGSHLFPDPGYILVTITVTDDDGGVGVDQFIVQLGEIQFLPAVFKQ